MSWLEFTGHTPAELTANYPIHGGNLPASLLQRRDPWLEAFSKIAPAVMSYLKNKQNDAIANHLMNLEQPPRAEAVDPSLQGAPATQPQTGGADALQAQQMYQQFLGSQPDTAMDDLKYQQEYRKAYPEQFPQGSIVSR